GTMRLSGANTFNGPLTVNAGVLRSNNAQSFYEPSLTVNSGGTLDMNGIGSTFVSLDGNGGTILQGAATLIIGSGAGGGTYSFAGNIIGTGTFAKSGLSGEYLSGTNSFGPV